MTEHTPPDSGHAAPPWAELAPHLTDFRLAETPQGPGCYLMRDTKDKVVYVGKAKNLRARLRSYLNENDTRYTVKFLLNRVGSIECLVTNTEKEAVLLENSLIKQYKPRYNVRLKDDKTYVSLKLNVRHEYPRLTVTRQHAKDGSKYYGPYSSAGAVRQTIRQFQKLFPLRLCRDSVLYNRARPCLYYQMKQCAAPCVGKVTPEDYKAIVRQVELAIEGRNDELERSFLEQIRTLSEALNFEEAATVRDRLFALRKTLERQKAVTVGEAGDRDVFGVHTEGRFREMQVMFFRSGKMVGGRSYTLKNGEMPLEEILGSFVLQYYADAPLIPDEVLLPVEIDEAETLEEILMDQRGKRVRIHSPQRGEKRQLLELAAKNAAQSFAEKRLKEEAQSDMLRDIQEKLGLAALPNRIECFDIATIQGEKTVGAMVVFEGGNPSKGRYRKFAVRGAQHDDFASMREVLLRRYQRAVEENDLPDLVLIDGGKGQLGVARTVLEDLGIEHIGLVAIAKSRAEEGGSHSPERFFVPGRKNPIILPQHSPVVLYMARIRDETHRFVNTFHRKRRTKSALSTPLVEIPGVGPKRARQLLQHFGSMARLREATVEEIAQTPGFSSQLAATVREYVSPARPSPATGEHP